LAVQSPKPLGSGDLSAITAPSSGVGNVEIPRLELVLEHLRGQGFEVIEGECLRKEWTGASVPSDRRARELARFLTDPRAAAVFPP